MATILLAESGSTKTDWCLLKKGSKPTLFKTQGINPYLQSQKDIEAMLADELPSGTIQKIPDVIEYYGAGAATADKQRLLAKALKNHFNSPFIQVNSDLLAAARGLCGSNPGLVCILGTGSSTCYYDGSKIKIQHPSLGYLAGDEGSGNYIGKRVLQYYAYGTFDTELKTGFEMRYGKDLKAILSKLYSEPFPNRYLATFANMLIDMRGHYMAENIIEDCLTDFFRTAILKYRQSWVTPLYFTGSVAAGFKDVLENLCAQYELEIGAIEKSPLEGLIKYHKKEL